MYRQREREREREKERKREGECRESWEEISWNEPDQSVRHGCGHMTSLTRPKSAKKKSLVNPWHNLNLG